MLDLLISSSFYGHVKCPKCGWNAHRVSAVPNLFPCLAISLILVAVLLPNTLRYQSALFEKHWAIQALMFSGWALAALLPVASVLAAIIVCWIDRKPLPSECPNCESQKLEKDDRIE